MLTASPSLVVPTLQGFRLRDRSLPWVQLLLQDVEKSVWEWLTLTDLESLFWTCREYAAHVRRWSSLKEVCAFTGFRCD